MNSTRKVAKTFRLALICHIMAMAIVLYGHSYAFAAANGTSAPHSQEFTFKYVWKNISFETNAKANTFDDALKIVAQKCFDFYMSKNKTTLNSETGMEIIDLCVNPHSRG